MISCHDLHTAGADPILGRRQFMRLAAMAGGVALFASTAPRLALAGQAKALLLSCMDYRLVDSVVKFMASKGLDNDYDYVVLAGASLGVVSDKFVRWHEVFWDHLALAMKLHHVEQVVVIDHRDCGAFTLALGADAVATPEKELHAHTQAIGAFVRQVHRRHPTLQTQGYLMALDGTAEAIVAA
jgi:carbonic anhydrase